MEEPSPYLIMNLVHIHIIKSTTPYSHNYKLYTDINPQNYSPRPQKLKISAKLIYLQENQAKQILLTCMPKHQILSQKYIHCWYCLLIAVAVLVTFYSSVCVFQKIKLNYNIHISKKEEFFPQIGSDTFYSDFFSHF